MSRLNVANFRHPDGTSDNISLDSSGRLGVGTSTPATVVDIEASADAYITIQPGTTDGNVGLLINNSAGTQKGVILYDTDDNYMLLSTENTERMRLTSTGDLRFNSGYGSVATAYGCRAWINFDGTSGSIGTGRASGNISSVTDNGTGDYTLNFSNAMPDANYAAIGNATSAVGGVVGIAVIPDYPTGTQTTTALRIQSTNTATSKFDAVNYSVAIFR